MRGIITSVFLRMNDQRTGTEVTAMQPLCQWWSTSTSGYVRTTCVQRLCTTQQWLCPTSYTLVFHHLASASMSYISYHDVEKMGESEANDKSIRPDLSAMTSITSGTTLPVTQVGNTIPPFVPQDTGALVFSPRNCMCDQINHKNSFVYR